MNLEVADFLASFLEGAKYLITALHGDGSERRFYRVVADRQTYILVEHLGGGRENDSYYYIGNHLREHGIAVPRFYAYSRQGLFLLEDLGDEHLSCRALLSDASSLEVLYHKALDTLIAMQQNATEGLRPEYCFDTPLYDQRLALEREGCYFKQAFLLAYLNLSSLPLGLDAELRRLSTLVERETRRVFLHRDFQSRNLMLKDGRLYVIDFQGARLGPPQYDLAALLWDPYVDLPYQLKERLFDSYVAEMGITDRDQFKEYFHYVALHRAMQVLGAFSFLTSVKHKPFFENYIPVGVRNLSALGSLLDPTLYPAFTETVARLRDLYACC
jgi:hypothetical protein